MNKRSLKCEIQMFRDINQNQEMQKIKKKQLKFEFDGITNLKGETTGIIKFTDEYFTKNLDISKLALPQNLLQNCRICHEEKRIKFYNRQYSWENDKQQLFQIFSGIIISHVQESLINQKQEDFKIKLRGIKNHGLIAYKRFHVTIGRFEEGDYLLYSKCSVNSFLQQIKNYILEQELLYDLDPFLQSRCFDKKYQRQVSKKIVENIQPQIQKIGENLGLNIYKMEANYYEKLLNQRRPEHSISLQVDGNGLNIHPFYLKIEEKMNSLNINIVEIDDQIPEENINNLQSIFPEYKDKIYKISQNAVLILQKKLQVMDIEEVKRKLKLQTWIIDNDIFTVEEIKTLHSQFRLNSLKPYMLKKKVYWQSIEFFNRSIKIICQRAVKDRFIQECVSLLKTFVKQRQACQRYDNKFIIQIFKKYYKKGFQQKFNVTFEIGETYIIRNNNTKYSDDIREQLKIVRDKIKNKLVRFICLQPLDKLQISQKIYMQKDKPPGYSHQLLGHCLYKMGNAMIKMKKVQSLNRQEDCITYVFDDRIKDSSLFHQIIQKNNINLQSFLVDAHKTKKPDRLRQYITQDCPYASKTVLLHAGPQKVTQTLRRDITTLFTLLIQRICGIVFQHDGGFLSDVFTIVLQQIYNESLTHGNNINHSMSLNKLQFEADLYYEGGQSHLSKIEQIMKKFMHPIRKVSQFALDLFDIEKIYALEYHSMKVKTESKVVRFSPIIAELLDYQLNRSIKTVNQSQKKKKFIFSINQNIQYQLVQFVISTKSGLCFKVTHDQSKKRWTRRPYIQKIQEKDHELTRIVSVIKKYLNRTDYIVISAQSKSDGIHGREIKYCNKFYMVKEREKKLSPITINLEQQKIHQVQNCLEFKIQRNKIENWYQITTYKQDLDIINSILDQ